MAYTIELWAQKETIIQLSDLKTVGWHIFNPVRNFNKYCVHSARFRLCVFRTIKQNEDNGVTCSASMNVQPALQVKAYLLFAQIEEFNMLTK